MPEQDFPPERQQPFSELQGILAQVIPQYGIELVDVRVKRLDYVESVREKVYARMISERKRIAAQFRSEGEGRRAELLGTMEKELRLIRCPPSAKTQPTVSWW
jgi:modulator of FtsH protease HflC